MPTLATSQESGALGPENRSPKIGPCDLQPVRARAMTRSTEQSDAPQPAAHGTSPAPRAALQAVQAEGGPANEPGARSRPGA
eukprot:3102034-Lingulodinium_polyedra.AAC.1